MAIEHELFRILLVESYDARYQGDPRRPVRVRPCEGQDLPTNINVECPKELKQKYPVGTIFKIRAKLTDREGGGLFLYSHHSWSYEVIKLGDE